jgi:methyl-accepting chemotaxis protein
MNWLNNVKIGKRMMLGFGIVVLLMVVVITLGVFSLKNADEDLKQIVKVNNVRMLHTNRASSEVKEVVICLRDLLLENVVAKRPEYVDRMKKSREIYDTDLKKVIEMTPKDDPKGQALLDKCKAAIEAVRPKNNRVIELALAGNNAEAVAFMNAEARPTLRALQDVFDELVEYNIERSAKRYEQASKAGQTARLVMLGIGGVAVALAVIIALFITRSITGPLAGGVEVASRIADGDLTVKVEVNSSDETGQLMAAMQAMVANLRQLVGQTVEISAGIASAADQLHSTSEQMSIGAEEVANQTNTVATAGEEMAATSTDIARNCHHAADASTHTTESATAGAAIVNDTIKGMGLIAQRVTASAKTVGALGARSDQIGAIIGTIEDIADQTNLLALNAAIEAARAGEQGRGFAVVADEVRALAERTTKATREIDVMIKAIQKETGEAVTAMEEGVHDVERETESAQKSGQALNEILERVSEVTMQVNQIATAAEEQTATTAEISHNMIQITEVIHQTARGAEETAAAASQLAGQAQQLQQLVAKFRL